MFLLELLNAVSEPNLNWLKPHGDSLTYATERTEVGLIQARTRHPNNVTEAQFLLIADPTVTTGLMY